MENATFLHIFYVKLNQQQCLTSLFDTYPS